MSNYDEQYWKERQENDRAEGKAILEKWLATQAATKFPDDMTGLPDRQDIDHSWHANTPRLEGYKFTPEEQLLIDTWRDQLIGTHSIYLDRYIKDFKDLVDHVNALNSGAPLAKRGRGRPPKPVDPAVAAAKEAKREAYKQWVKDCQERKARIQAAKVELESRKKLCAAYIKEVQDALVYWEATPVPPQP